MAQPMPLATFIHWLSLHGPASDGPPAAGPL